MTQMAKAKTKPNLALFEQKLGEVADGCQQMLQLCEALRRANRRAEAYFDLVADAAVCGDVIRAKLESLAEIIETLEDAIPDND